MRFPGGRSLYRAFGQKRGRSSYGVINYLGIPNLGRWPASEDPYPGDRLGKSVSAVSIAQFFTLAAQGRMIDGPTSKAILAHLDINKGGCATNQPDLRTLVGKGFIAAKCGFEAPTDPAFMHVPLYYKDATSAREFVMVILTKNHKWPIIRSLFSDLIALVP